MVDVCAAQQSTCLSYSSPGETSISSINPMQATGPFANPHSTGAVLLWESNRSASGSDGKQDTAQEALGLYDRKRRREAHVKCTFVYPKAKKQKSLCVNYVNKSVVEVESLPAPLHSKSVDGRKPETQLSNGVDDSADATSKEQLDALLLSKGLLAHGEINLKLEDQKGEVHEAAMSQVACVNQEKGHRVVDLLLACAKSLEGCHFKTALYILLKLQARITIKGDSMQRLGVYFADAIATRLQLHKEARLAMGVWQALRNVRATQEILKAFFTMNKLWPVEQFAYFCTNQAIVEAVEKHKAIHVVDVNISRGFQWPSLIQSLGARPQGPPALLRLTGIGPDSDALSRAGARLTQFAAGYGIRFEFEGIQAFDAQLEDVILDNCTPTPNMATIVNCVHHLHRLIGEPGDARLARLLRGVRRRGPTIITLVEREANINSMQFTKRFIEALQHYAAVLDAMEEGAKQAGVTESERLEAEAVYVAAEVRNIVAHEGDDRVERYEASASWRQRMEAGGLRMVPWSWKARKQAEELLEKHWASYGYTVCHAKGGFLALQWRSLNFVTASAWKCPGTPFPDPPIDGASSMSAYKHNQ